MSRSVRSVLVAGVSVLAAGIVVVPPSVAPRAPAATVATRTASQVAPRIDLAASIRPLHVEPPSPQKFAAAVAAIERIDPSAHRVATPDLPRALAPAPLNTASNVVEAGYQFIQYWVDYGVQLSTYVLGFIPYGYLIADQINIVYFNLIRPIANSVVYQLITPVLNDPLNLASYVNGLVAVGQTSINAVINTAIAEFNNFFGWLIPPLPPRPLAVAKTIPPVADDVVTPVAAKLASPPAATADPLEPAVEEHQKADAKVPESAVEAETSSPAKDEEPATVEPELKTTPTTSSANGVQAQGQVRDATVGAVKATASESTADTDAAAPKDTKDAPTTGAKPATQPATTPAESAAADASPSTKDTPTGEKD